MAPEYKIPLSNRIFRWFFRPLFRVLFHILCTVKISGLENVPDSGSYLVASNHISIFEPPFIIAFWPCPMEAIGAVEIWSRSGQSLLVRLYGGIQVHRGQFDRQSINQMIAAVENGHPLLIAPEGGRTHVTAMRRGLPGTAYIAHKTNLKVLPVGITGTSDDLLQKVWASFLGRKPRVCLEMHIGEPIQLPEITGRGEARRQALQDNVDLIMVQIGTLLPEPYHGVYADQIQKTHQTP